MSLAEKLMGFMGYEFEDEEDWEEAPAPKPRAKRSGDGGEIQIFYIRLEKPADAHKVADLLAENRPVICSIANTPRDTARRLIDFISGAAYTRDGQVEHIATDTYLFAPFDVELIGGED